MRPREARLGLPDGGRGDSNGGVGFQNDGGRSMKQRANKHVSGIRKQVDLYFSSPLFLLILVAAFMLM